MWATALLNNAVGIISKVLMNEVSNTLLIFEESQCGYQVKCVISVLTEFYKITELLRAATLIGQ